MQPNSSSASWDGNAKVHIQYCGGGGYKWKADMIKEAVQAAVQDKDGNGITVEYTKDPGVTGRLEVTVIKGDNKNLVHSKKNTGEDVKTKQAAGAVVAKIIAAL